MTKAGLQLIKEVGHKTGIIQIIGPDQPGFTSELKEGETVVYEHVQKKINDLDLVFVKDILFLCNKKTIDQPSG